MENKAPITWPSIYLIGLLEKERKRLNEKKIIDYSSSISKKY